MISRKVYAFKVDAGHTTSGNPRRGWLIFEPDGRYLGFVDEGYYGRGALRSAAKHVVELGEVPTTPSAYRTLIKEKLVSD